MHQPLLIADSGGTKTDWCYIDEHRNKHFFTSESYHPVNWSEEFTRRINIFWGQLSQYKSAELHFFCSGCLKLEKSTELTHMFNDIGFSNVQVKSDLHAAGLSLFGNDNGNVAILGTGSVYFEWKNGEVFSIKGGKGFETGDEGSGFYFGKLIFKAFQENRLTPEQKLIVEENTDILNLVEEPILKNQKEIFSQIPHQLKEYKKHFSGLHQKNVDLFFSSIKSEKSILFVRIVGGYFTAHSSIFLPFLSNQDIEVEQFTNRPIESLVDYFVRLTE